MKTYHVTTFGCQMNSRDSEKLKGMLAALGYEEIDSEEADIVIFNTCTVRENANERLYGHIGELSHAKKRNPHMIIGICGCMMQDEEAVKTVTKRFPYVDLIFGTFNLHKLPELIKQVQTENKRVISIVKDSKEIVEDIPSIRDFPFKSGVNITYGCDNFCSYCIVPFVRGRERSRKPEDIIKECESLVADGVSEIMLLGQNVNSYGKGLEPNISFSQLLESVAKVPGLKRLKFMTSHPKDLTMDIVEVMKNNDNICNYIHLPLQSGSSKVLKEMNRKYDREKYVELVNNIRKEIPDIALTTDIIVGFPGETQEDFNETLEVVKECRFDGAFTFIYSPRHGTKASEMEQLPKEEVDKRFPKLLEVVRKISEEEYKKRIGVIDEVLVESINKKLDGYVTGKTTHNGTVHFKGGEDLIGKIVEVKLNECHGFYYMGELV